MVNEHYNPSDKTSKYCMKKEEVTPPTLTSPEVTATTTTIAQNNSSSTLSPKTEVTSAKPVETTTLAPVPEVTTPKAAPIKPPTTTTHQPSTVKPTESDEVTIRPAPAPEASHFWGGILIPLVIVAAFIGSVIAIRKYDLLDRAYNRIRHRHTPAQHYNGLMENDFDDDPLLI